MNGKIRVSIVATSLKGSSVSPDPRPPIFNVVNGSYNRGNNFSDNLFSKTNIDQNYANSIDGANALKLDETYEIKNSEEQNALIDSFESKEETKIAEEAMESTHNLNEIPTGVSIESASYMENNTDLIRENKPLFDSNILEENLEKENTPKLFSDDQTSVIAEKNESKQDDISEELFDQDINEEEDFEIPAFLRRQKF